jgi:hypothetical protein
VPWHCGCIGLNGIGFPLITGMGFPLVKWWRAPKGTRRVREGVELVGNGLDLVGGSARVSGGYSTCPLATRDSFPPFLDRRATGYRVRLESQQSNLRASDLKAEFPAMIGFVAEKSGRSGFFTLARC